MPKLFTKCIQNSCSKEICLKIKKHVVTARSALLSKQSLYSQQSNHSFYQHVYNGLIDLQNNKRIAFAIYWEYEKGLSILVFIEERLLGAAQHRMFQNLFIPKVGKLFQGNYLICRTSLFSSCYNGRN